MKVILSILVIIIIILIITKGVNIIRNFIAAIKNLAALVKSLAVWINRKVEGRFFVKAEDGSCAMDKVIGNVTIIAFVMSIFCSIDFIRGVWEIISGHANELYLEFGYWHYLWEKIAGGLYVGGIVSLVFLVVFAVKDLKKYDRGKARWRRGLFVFLWGLLLYNIITISLSFLSLLYLAAILAFIGLAMAGSTVIGGIQSALSDNTYKLKDEDGTIVKGNDLIGYLDEKGEVYERHGNEFTKKY